SNSNVPTPQNIPVSAVHQDAYYIRLIMSNDNKAVQKVAQDYQNYGYTPLMFYTSDSNHIALIEGGKSWFSAFFLKLKIWFRDQLPSGSRIVKLQKDWTGPIFLDAPESQNAGSNPYVTQKSGAEMPPDLKDYGLEPPDAPSQKTLPEPPVYDITNKKNQSEDSAKKPSKSQAIYDIVRDFFTPTSSDTVKNEPLDRYLLVAGKKNTLKKAKKFGVRYVKKGFAVFIWEKADSSYSIVIGEPNTKENCKALQLELSDIITLQNGIIEPHSQEWLKQIFP
ncbi:hypothetical protein KAH55_14605, partial [bacterium]|nr:hypothetical protein [bacterium]